MASARESICHNDPNFAVICSFLNRYSDILGIPKISFQELQTYLEETKYVSDVLIDLHVRLLRKLGKTNANFEKWEKCVTKFCYAYSGVDGWEMEELGYSKVSLNTRLRILKNLLEAQFDSNNRFKDKINEIDATELRFLPIGRDKNGLAYWYLLDEDFNLRVYREEQDDEDAGTWKLVCSNRNELADLISKLQSNEVMPDKDKLSTTSGDSDGKDEDSVSGAKVKFENEESNEDVKVKTEPKDASDEQEVMVKSEDDTGKVPEVKLKTDKISESKLVEDGELVKNKDRIQKSELKEASVILVKTDDSIIQSYWGVKSKTTEVSESSSITDVSREDSCTEGIGPRNEKLSETSKSKLENLLKTAADDSLKQKDPSNEELEKSSTNYKPPSENSKCIKTSERAAEAKQDTQEMCRGSETGVPDNCEKKNFSEATSDKVREVSVIKAGHISETKLCTAENVCNESNICSTNLKHNDNLSLRRQLSKTGDGSEKHSKMVSPSVEAKQPERTSTNSSSVDIAKKSELLGDNAVKISDQDTKGVKTVRLPTERTQDSECKEQVENLPSEIDSCSHVDKDLSKSEKTDLEKVCKPSSTIPITSPKSDNQADGKSVNLNIAKEKRGVADKLDGEIKDGSAGEENAKKPEESQKDKLLSTDSTKLAQKSDESVEEEGKNKLDLIKSGQDGLLTINNPSLGDNKILSIKDRPVLSSTDSEKTVTDDTQSKQGDSALGSTLTTDSKKILMDDTQSKQGDSALGLPSVTDSKKIVKDDTPSKQGDPSLGTQSTTDCKKIVMDDTPSKQGDCALGTQSTTDSKKIVMDDTPSKQDDLADSEKTVTDDRPSKQGDKAMGSSLVTESEKAVADNTPSKQGDTAMGSSLVTESEKTVTDDRPSKQGDTAMGSSSVTESEKTVTDDMPSTQGDPASGSDRSSSSTTSEKVVTGDRQSKQGEAAMGSSLVTHVEKIVTDDMPSEAVDSAGISSNTGAPKTAEVSSIKSITIAERDQKDKLECSTQHKNYCKTSEHNEVETMKSAEHVAELSERTEDKTCEIYSKAESPNTVSDKEIASSTTCTEKELSRKTEATEKESSQYAQEILKSKSKDVDVEKTKEDCTPKNDETEQLQSAKEVSEVVQDDLETTKDTTRNVSLEDRDTKQETAHKETDQTADSKNDSKKSEDKLSERVGDKKEVLTVGGVKEAKIDKLEVKEVTKEVEADENQRKTKHKKDDDKEYHIKDSKVEEGKLKQAKVDRCKNAVTKTGVAKTPDTVCDSTLKITGEDSGKTDLKEKETSVEVLKPAHVNVGVETEDNKKIETSETKQSKKPEDRSEQQDCSRECDDDKGDSTTLTEKTNKSIGGISDSPSQRNHPEKSRNDDPKVTDTQATSKDQQGTEAKDEPGRKRSETSKSTTGSIEKESPRKADTGGESTERQLLGKDGAKDCSPEKEPSTKDSPEKESSKKDGPEKEPRTKDSLEKEPSTKESPKKEPSTKDDSCEKKPLGKYDSEEDSTEKEPSSKTGSKEEALNKNSSGKHEPSGKDKSKEDSKKESSAKHSKEDSKVKSTEEHKTDERKAKDSSADNKDEKSEDEDEEKEIKSSSKQTPLKAASKRKSTRIASVEKSLRQKVAKNTDVNEPEKSEKAEGKGAEDVASAKAGKASAQHDAPKEVEGNEDIKTRQNPSSEKKGDSNEMSSDVKTDNSRSSRKQKLQVKEDSQDGIAEKEETEEEIMPTRSMRTRATRSQVSHGGNRGGNRAVGRGGSRGGGRVGQASPRAPKRQAPVESSDQSSAESEEEPVVKQAKRGRARGRGRGGNRGGARRSLAKKMAEDSDDSDDDIPLSKIGSATKNRGGRARGRGGRGGAKGAREKAAEVVTPVRKSSRPRKRKKVESDEEFQVKQTRGRGRGGGRRGRQRRLMTSDDDTDREQEEEEERLVFEALEATGSSEDQLLFSSSSDSPEEEADDDYSPQKKGRNARRAAARSGEHELVTAGDKDESQSDVDDDTPCCKCLKYNQPEWILLCDKCDAGYHTACLRPPLMIIPDGDWHCPPCQHAMLVEKLSENLKELDTALKKYERLLKRKERLAYVGISLDNIVKEERKENVAPEYLDFEYDYDYDYDHKPKKKHRHRHRHRHKHRDRDRHRQNSPRPKEEVFQQRTCRARTTVSYQFKEYDELINSAIQDDVKEPPPPGISRGKDMYNIEEAESKPSPVSKSKRRKKRRLTGLDDDFEDDDDDDSEEYKATDDSDVTHVEEEEEEVDDASSSGSDGRWRSIRTRRFGKPTRRSSRKGGRWTRYDADFVVDDDYDSEGSDNCRRSTRSATKRRVCYRESNSDESEGGSTPSADDSSSDDSRPSKRRKRTKITKIKQKALKSRKRKGVLYSDESEEEAVETEEEGDSETSRGSNSATSDDDSEPKSKAVVKTKLNATKKKRIIESDPSENSSDSGSEKGAKVRQTQRTSAKRINFNKLLDSDSGEETEETTFIDNKPETKGKLSVKKLEKEESESEESKKDDKSDENSEESDKSGPSTRRRIKITVDNKVVERTNSPREELVTEPQNGDSEKSESPKVSNNSSNGNSMEEAGLVPEAAPSNGHGFDRYTPQMPPPFPHGYGYDTNQYQYYPNNQTDTYQPQGYFPPPQGNMPYRSPPGHHPGIPQSEMSGQYSGVYGAGDQRHPGMSPGHTMRSPPRDVPLPPSGPHRPGMPPIPQPGHMMPYPEHRQDQRMMHHQGSDPRYQELQPPPPNGGRRYGGMPPPPHGGYMRPGVPSGIEPGSHRGMYPDGRPPARPSESTHGQPRGSFMMESILRPKGYGEGDDDDLSDVSDLISYVTQDT